jgi:colicin import membrane protein
MSELEAAAEAALEKLSTSAEKKAAQMAAAAAPAASRGGREGLSNNNSAEEGAAPRTPRSGMGGGDSDTLRATGSRALQPMAPSAAAGASPSRTGNYDLFSPTQNKGANGLVAFSLVDAATGKPLPELEVLKEQRRKVEVRETLAKQLAEHQAADARSALLQQSYIQAEGEMLARASAVDAARRSESMRKAAEDAQETHRLLAERARLRAEEEARLRAEGEAQIVRMKAEYAAEQARIKAKMEADREALVAAKREGEEMRRAAQEAARKAQEEAQQLQSAYGARERAAETAMKNKYAHIAAHQETLARLLQESTAEYREKMDRYYTIQEEKAVRQAKLDAEALQARKERSKQRQLDTAAAVREQISEKAAAKKAAREAELALSQVAKELSDTVANEKKALSAKKSQDKRTMYVDLAKQLDRKAAIVAAGPEPKYKPYEDGLGTSLVLNTKSSDMDTETNFILTARQIHNEGKPAARGNRSDEIAPLLGFGAPFLTKIEEESQRAQIEEPAPEQAIQNMQPRLAFGGTQPSNLVIKGSKPAPAAAVKK